MKQYLEPLGGLLFILFFSWCLLDNVEKEKTQAEMETRPITVEAPVDSIHVVHVERTTGAMTWEVTLMSKRTFVVYRRYTTEVPVFVVVK